MCWQLHAAVLHQVVSHGQLSPHVSHLPLPKGVVGVPHKPNLAHSVLVGKQALVAVTKVEAPHLWMKLHTPAVVSTRGLHREATQPSREIFAAKHGNTLSTACVSGWHAVGRGCRAAEPSDMPATTAHHNHRSTMVAQQMKGRQPCIHTLAV